MKQTIIVTHRCGHLRTYEDDLPPAMWPRLEEQLKHQDCLECRGPRTSEAKRNRGYEAAVAGLWRLCSIKRDIAEAVTRVEALERDLIEAKRLLSKLYQELTEAEETPTPR
jgi:hypothetical protein